MSRDISFVVNGETRSSHNAMKLADLIAELGLTHLRVAVELNFEVIPRDQHESTTIENGDRLEIVSFVGGG